MMINIVLMLSMFQIPTQSTYSPTPTRIKDHVYLSNNSLGKVEISWPEFTTKDGYRVKSGSLSYDLDKTHEIDTMLVPNQGSTPIGSYYTVKYTFENGQSYNEYWSVPISNLSLTTKEVAITLAAESLDFQYYWGRQSPSPCKDGYELNSQGNCHHDDGCNDYAYNPLANPKVVVSAHLPCTSKPKVSVSNPVGEPPINILDKSNPFYNILDSSNPNFNNLIANEPKLPIHISLVCTQTPIASTNGSFLLNCDIDPISIPYQNLIPSLTPPKEPIP